MVNLFQELQIIQYTKMKNIDQYTLYEKSHELLDHNKFYYFGYVHGETNGSNSNIATKIWGGINKNMVLSGKRFGNAGDFDDYNIEKLIATKPFILYNNVDNFPNINSYLIPVREGIEVKIYSEKDLIENAIGSSIEEDEFPNITNLIDYESKFQIITITGVELNDKFIPRIENNEIMLF